MVVVTSFQGSDNFKFALYSIVAWGLPLILLSFVVLIDRDVIGSLAGVQPAVGIGSCFLSISGLQLYFYPPIFVLLCFNSIMFCITVYALWRTKRFSRRAGLHKVLSTASTSKSQVTCATGLPLMPLICFPLYAGEMEFTQANRGPSDGL